MRQPRLQALADSLQGSLEMEDDWDLADPGVLTIWRSTLLRAEADYRDRLADPLPEVADRSRAAGWPSCGWPYSWPERPWRG